MNTKGIPQLTPEQKERAKGLAYLALDMAKMHGDYKKGDAVKQIKQLGSRFAEDSVRAEAIRLLKGE